MNVVSSVSWSAAKYGNEAEVGDALAEAFQTGLVKREDLFITTKVNLSSTSQNAMLLPPSQIISHSKNIGESKHLKFEQNYRKNHKDL